MLKALFKKQLMEIGSYFFQDRKTGKNRSKSGIIGYSLLYAVTCVFLFGVFFYVGKMLCAPLVTIGMGWLYHAIMCLMSLALGVFGSVFNTYSTLYVAKDNELLLSLPVPPSRILTVRLFGVWFWGFFYEVLVLLPAMVVYWITAAPGAVAVIFDLFVILVLSLFILSISCILGWIVAKINGKLKSKSFITVIISLAFLGAYFYFYTQAYTLLQQLIGNADIVGKKIKGAVYPVYLMGRGAEGDALSLLLFTVIVLAVFAVIWLVLSRSFLKLASSGSGTVKRKYRETSVKIRNVSGALLSKEIRHLLSSATYMLNCCLGTLILIVIAAAAIIKRSFILEVMSSFSIGNEGIIPLIACALICMTSSMNDITAPSVSLEGKSIWLMQSLPVSAWQVLKAKLNLHLLITEIPVFICSVCLAIAINSSIYFSLMLILLPMLFTLLTASLGLAINLKMPNLNWSSETVAVKQSMGVMIALFSGWIIVIALGILYYAVYKYINTELFMLLCGIFLSVISAALLCWLKKRGSRIFEAL